LADFSRNTTLALEIKGEGERAPSYIVLAPGGMVNRVFLRWGAHGPGEHRHRGRAPWKAAAGSTGNFTFLRAVSARGHGCLSKIEAPASSPVVGKTALLSGGGDDVRVHRPEKVRIVEARERDHWYWRLENDPLEEDRRLSRRQGDGARTVDELVS